MEETKRLPQKNIIIILVCLLLVYGEIAGIYHSFSKHAKEDGLYSVFIPPFAWYRSVEVFLHKNNESIDWDKQLKTDTKDCLLVLTQYGKADSTSIQQAVAELKSRIKKYPKDKYEYVKDFGTKYFLYYRAAQKDFNRWIIKFFNGGDVKYQKSDALIAAQANLFKFGVDELNNSIKHNDSLFVLLKSEYGRMKEQYVKATPEGKKLFLEVIFRKDNINIKNITRAYQNIFDEEIKQ